MKIAIASSGKSLSDQVDFRFGRCPYFLIVDTETEKFEVLDNNATQVFRGAGIAASQIIANKGVKAVIASNFGPNAFNVLSQANINAFRAVKISCQEALKKYKEGKLSQAKMANILPGQALNKQ